MKLWMKAASVCLLAGVVIGGGVIVVRSRSLASGRLELQQNGASGFDKALSSLKLADRLGSRDAAYEIGKCYLDGKVTKADTKAAMSWLQKAAGHSHPEAMAIVGQAMLEGNDLQKDLTAGAQYLRRSAESGSPLGMFHFGRALNNGQGVAQDNQLGNSWIDRAAEAGEADAAFTQGAGYLLAGTNTKKAIQFLEIAANKGSDAATMLLFNAYIGSVGGTPDPIKALALLNKKSGDGNAWATYKLGVAYARGELGLKSDEKEAERLVRLAADKGNLDARKLVTVMDAPKEDPISLVGPQVVIDGGGYARVQGLVKNTSSRDLDAHVQFDLVSPSGVILENYQKTLFRIPPGGAQQIEFAIAPYHRDAHVQVRGVKWR